MTPRNSSPESAVAVAEHTDTSEQPLPPHRIRFPRALGAGAGLLAAGLCLALVGGTVWALLRPTYTVQLRDGVAVVDQAASSANVEFAAVGWLAVITGVLGVVLAGLALRQERKGETAGGVWELLWLILVAAATSFTVYACGEVVVGTLHPVADHAAGADSEPFTVAPRVTPGVTLLVGPFVAAVLYWFCGFVAAGLASGGAAPRAGDDAAPRTGDDAGSGPRDATSN